MSFTYVQCTYKTISILTTCVFVFHRYVWAKNIQTLTSKMYTCMCFSDIYRCLQVFRDVYKKEKNIYIPLALWPRWVALPYHRLEARNWTLLCNEKHCGWHLSCCTTHDPQQDTNNCRFCKDFSNAQMMLIISCQIVQDATYLRWHLFWSAS